MQFTGIIPARYASTRFPGKPLVDLGGKSMLQRVYEQALQSRYLSEVIIATDDKRIREHAEAFEAKVCMTSDEHPSGTDRCYEVVEKMQLKSDVILNIQGDEPFINPGHIDALCVCFEDPLTQIATLVKEIENIMVLTNPNAPKVVLDIHQFALYFSRHPLPFYRSAETHDWPKLHTYYQHIGIYAYRTEVLSEITKLNPSSLEIAESLEQLRWLENGYRIKTAKVQGESHAIDTPEDLERVKKLFHLV